MNDTLYQRVCSLCNKSWTFPINHTYGYETDDEKKNWLCGNCFFDNASADDIAREVFGFEDTQAEVIGEFARELEKVKDKVFPTKKPPKTIYDFNSWKHYVGWPIFLVMVSYVVRKIYRTKTRKRKESKNYLVEIHRIFKEWQLNMYASTGAYVVGFFLIQQAIVKWIEPKIDDWLIAKKLITLSVVCLVIGIGFYIDGIITSSLKTPLQRLGIRIENANIDEKVKKSLLSKTQQVSELFKETLKRFGLLAVVGLLTKLIETFWNKDIISYLSYAVPIAGAVKIIWDIDKTLKKLKLND